MRFFSGLFMLFDLHSRFGRLLKSKRALDLSYRGDTVVQVGRTVLVLKVERKWNWKAALRCRCRAAVHA